MENILVIAITLITLGSPKEWVEVSRRVMPLDWCLKKSEMVYNRPDDQTKYLVVCVPTEQGEPHNAS